MKLIINDSTIKIEEFKEIETDIKAQHKELLTNLTKTINALKNNYIVASAYGQELDILFNKAVNSNYDHNYTNKVKCYIYTIFYITINISLINFIKLHYVLFNFL